MQNFAESREIYAWQRLAEGLMGKKRRKKERKKLKTCKSVNWYG